METRRRVGTSTVRPLRDGYRIILLIIRLMALFEPLQVFLPIAAGLVGLGVAYGLYYALTLIGVGSVFILAGSLLAQGMVELKTERNLKHGG